MIRISVTNGKKPYNYEWKNAAGEVKSTSRQLKDNNLAPGNYTVTVTDADGKTVSATYTLNAPYNLTGTATPQKVKCKGGSDGQVRISMDDGDPDYQWTLFYADSRGNVKRRLADGTEVDYTGTSTNIRFTINRLKADNYSITITDDSGCTGTINFTITEPATLFKYKEYTQVAPKCHNSSDGSLTPTFEGGDTPYTYQWAKGGTPLAGKTTQTLSGISAGTYTVTATDANGCVKSADLELVPPDPVAVTGGVKKNVTCKNGTDGEIEVGGSGGTGIYTYAWKENGVTSTVTTAARTGLKAGIPYEVTVTDSNGCPATKTFTLTEPDAIVVTAPASLITHVACKGESTGAISIGITGGSEVYSSFLWTKTGSTTTWTTRNISSLSAGNYKVTVTDSEGCTGELANIEVKESSDLLTVPVPALANAITCHDGSDGSLTANPAVGTPIGGGTPSYTYQWEKDGSTLPGKTTQTISGLAVGNYTVTVTDNNNCVRSSSYTLTDPDPIAVTVTNKIKPKCNGDTNGSITVSASAGTAPYTYNWTWGGGSRNTGASPTLSNVGAGIYAVTVRDSKGCETALVIILGQPDLLEFDRTTVKQITCFSYNNGEIEVFMKSGTSPYAYSWAHDPSLTTSKITGLTENNYSVTVTDANGCTVNRSFAILKEPDQLDATFKSKENIKCKEDASGAFELNVRGGTRPYSFKRKSDGTDFPNVEETAPNSGVFRLSGLGAGTHTVEIRDANGCITADETVTLTEPPTLLTLNREVERNITQNGANDGYIKVSASGGSTALGGASATYQFSWTKDGSPYEGAKTVNPPASDEKSGLAPGTYVVSVEDERGCVKSETFVITDPPAITLSGSISKITCFGLTDGKIDLTVSGGVPPYTYKWSNGPTTQDVENLDNGTYTVTVKDARGGEKQESFNLTDPAELKIAVTGTTDVKCKGDPSGAIDITVTGGTGAYTYLWNTGTNTQDLEGITDGTYTVTVTDANGCTKTETITIAEPDFGLQVAESITHILCHGEATGKIDLTVTGGSGTYTYQWSSGQTTRVIENLTAGDYTVTVRDAEGCPFVKTYQVKQPEALALSETKSNVSFFGEGDGAIGITVTGGKEPYTYTWTYSGTSEVFSADKDISGLAPGKYSLKIVDANNCELKRDFEITQEPELVITTSPTPVSCFGGSDGKIATDVTGGVPPYTYAWSNGATTKDLSGLAGASYTLTLTDNVGCTATAEVLVETPAAALNATGEITGVACSRGRSGGVELTVTGGTTPYTFRWSNGNTLKDLLAVPKGEYSVNVEDSRGCTFDPLSFTIAEESAIEMTFETKEPTCFGDSNGSILLKSVTGGVPPYDYLWSNGQTSKDLHNVTSGSYTVTITDANKCTVSQSILLGPERGLDIEVNKTDVSCKGFADGAITLNVFGGSGQYTYAWGHGVTTKNLAGIRAGVYTVKVTDKENGCSSESTINIGEPSLPLSLSVDHTDKLTCFGDTDGTATAKPAGGTKPYSYVWNNGQRTQKASGLKAGTHNVLVTDFNGCSRQYAFEIKQPEAPISVKASGKMHLDCPGDTDGSIAVKVSGGEGKYRLRWNNGVVADRLTNLKAGDYTLTVTDGRGCVHEEVLTVTEPKPLRIARSVVNDVKCFGDRNGSIEIEAAGGTGDYTYRWSNGSTDKNLIGVGTGNYTVTVTDAKGCTHEAAFKLDTAPLFELKPAVTKISCAGERDASISLNITGGKAPYEIRWGHGETAETITNLKEGAYTVSVTDANGCKLEEKFVLTQPLPLKLDAVVKNAEACDNPESGSIKLLVTGGWEPYTYSWVHDPTLPILQKVPPGLYTVTVTDKFKCKITSTCRVTRPAPLSIQLKPELMADCDKETQFYRVTTEVKGGFGNYQYKWNRGNSTTKVMETNTAGRLTLRVTDDKGCQRSESMDLVFPGFAAPSFTFDAKSLQRDSILIINDSVRFTDTSGGTLKSWQWDFGDGLTSQKQNPTHAYASIGTYRVNLTVTDVTGCVRQTSKSLKILRGYTLMIPDAFTPDGDGLNDYFLLHMKGIKNFQFTIYNSWGEAIFQTEDLETRGWDGMVSGRTADIGSYVYKFTGTTFNGLKVERTNSLALIR